MSFFPRSPLWLRYGIIAAVLQALVLAIGLINLYSMVFGGFALPGIWIAPEYLMPIDNQYSPWIDVFLMYPLYLLGSFAIGALMGQFLQAKRGPSK